MNFYVEIEVYAMTHCIWLSSMLVLSMNFQINPYLNFTYLATPVFMLVADTKSLRVPFVMGVKV